MGVVRGEFKFFGIVVVVVEFSRGDAGVGGVRSVGATGATRDKGRFVPDSRVGAIVRMGRPGTEQGEETDSRYELGDP